MKIKTVRKWADEANPKVVDAVAALIAAIVLGCYVYLGHLITELFK